MVPLTPPDDTMIKPDDNMSDSISSPRNSSLSMREIVAVFGSPTSVSRPHSQQSNGNQVSSANASILEAPSDRKKGPPRPPKPAALEQPPTAPGEGNVEISQACLEPGPPRYQNPRSHIKVPFVKSTLDIKHIGARTWKRTKSTKVFQETADDIKDLRANERGQEGLCSRCEGLVALQGTPAGMKRLFGQAQEWASPLSRVLFHSSWCVLCWMILDSLCKPECDPLLHPAVLNYIQPELKGFTMKMWAEQGWDFNDEHWPFGHGHERLEGETHVLGRRFEEFEAICWTGLKIFGYHKIRQLVNHQAPLGQSAREIFYQEKIRELQDPKLHPLSCVVKITMSDTSNPGLLQAKLWGYGREPRAGVQCLSSFPLRLVTLKPSSNPLPHHQRCGKLLDPEWIDPSVGRLWLKECEGHHGDQCSVPGWASAIQPPGFLRVVDVKNYCIKEIKDPRCRYLALSYTWGDRTRVMLKKRNQHALKQKSGLLQYLTPQQQTILDTIDVVRAMGVEYLWVDALCIVQDDQVDLDKQISVMDRIYSSAVATLVAADGRGVYYGLPGIRGTREHFTGKRRQISQRYVEINNTLAVAAPLSTRGDEYDIDGSVWNSRAWTYQERLLSRRLIIFRHGQIIWHCRRMICREDMRADDSGVPLPRLDWLTLKKEHFGEDIDPGWSEGCTEVNRFRVTRLVRPSTFAQYTKAVGQYTHRDAKEKEEVMKAFAGLSRIFQICFQSTMNFGLPERFLDIALLWRPIEGLKRREGFPSWSWCGWIGRVAYNDAFDIQHDRHTNSLSYKANETGEEGIQTFIRWHVWGEETHTLVPANGTGLGFSYDKQHAPRDWEQGPSCLHGNGDVRPGIVPPVKAHPPQGDIALLRKCLYFWSSTTVNFEIGEPIHQASDKQWNTSKPPRRFYLQNKYGERVGNVLLDGIDDGWIKRERFEFVQICSAKFHQMDIEPKDIEGFPVYLLMMVEWNEEMKIATRLGIGRVYKGHWDVVEPKLKFIQLA